MMPFRQAWRRSSLRFLTFLVDDKVALRPPNPVHLVLHQRADWTPQQFTETLGPLLRGVLSMKTLLSTKGGY